jgi:hypothetical protein
MACGASNLERRFADVGAERWAEAAFEIAVCVLR